MKFFREINQAAIGLLREERLPAEKRSASLRTRQADPLVQFALKDAVANVLCPAAKLWNTGTGANAMREALSLMGGYGITEDCPGFLAYKWMDAQLEATYEGPEAVQRRNLSVTMTNELFLAQYQQWIRDMRKIAEHRPGTGACTLATAMQLWLWTYQHLQSRHRRRRRRAVPERAPGCDLPAGRCAVLAARRAPVHPRRHRTRSEGPENPVVAEGFAGTLEFLHRPVPHPVGALGRRSGPHLRRAGLRL